jgi:hypothetical protein
MFKTYNPEWFKYRKEIISGDAWSGDYLDEGDR